MFSTSATNASPAAPPVTPAANLNFLDLWFKSLALFKALWRLSALGFVPACLIVSPTFTPNILATLGVLAIDLAPNSK